MIKVILFGIHNKSTKIIGANLIGNISVTNSESNNTYTPGIAYAQALLLGQYENNIIPILVDETGKLII